MIKEKHKWIIEELKKLREKGLIELPRKRSGKGYSEFPIRWGITGYFQDYAVEDLGIKAKVFASYSVKSGIGGIIPVDTETYKKTNNLIFQRALKNSNYIQNRKKKSEIYANQLEEFCEKKLSKENIEKANKRELWALYNLFKEIYERYEFYNSIWFRISNPLEEEILNRLKNKGCKDFEDIQLILTTSHQSFANKENIDFLKAVLKTKKGSNINNEAETLSKKYHWIPFGHTGPELFNTQHYVEEIKKEMKNQNIEKELENAINFYPNIKEKQKEIFKKYNLDKETIRLIKDLHLLSIMQDDRKELISKTHINWVNNLMTKIGSYFKLTGRETANIYPKFIKKCLLDDKVDLELYTKRNKSKTKIKITESEGYTDYFDEDADEFLKYLISNEKTDILKGSTACTGEAKGKAKILKDASEGHKINKGDILITTMTTPDFLPYMKLAGAIITDEGGITCHAAIVSRELNIPCIIATKNATEVFKDNDILEIDATKGIVKKLKSEIN